MTRWLPGLRLLREYKREWLRRDLVAGLVLTTMLVPVGIAYAEASGVPGIHGLYATIVALLAYALFGPSRIPRGPSRSPRRWPWYRAWPASPRAWRGWVSSPSSSRSPSATAT